MYLRLLDVRPGERVLDVGCGSGVVMREVARRVSPDGVTFGLDPSLSFLTVAREELAEQAGLASVIELCRGPSMQRHSFSLRGSADRSPRSHARALGRSPDTAPVGLSDPVRGRRECERGLPGAGDRAEDAVPL